MMTNQPNESGAGSKVNDHVGKPPRNTKPPKPRPVIDVDFKKLRKVGVFAPVIQISIGRKPPVPGGNEGKVTAIVVKRQKILVLSKDEIDQLPVGRDGKKTIQLNIRGRQGPDLKAKVIRVSECPNPEGEYSRYSRLAKKTYMVLIEFDKRIEPGTAVKQVEKEQDIQANNFLLNSEPSGSTPTRPVQDDSVTEKVRPSDFQIADQKDYDHYADEGELVVAVVDSGVKFDLINSSENSSALSEVDHYEYRVQGTDKVVKFRLARGRETCNIQPPAIGYCGITDYLTYKTLPQKRKDEDFPLLKELNDYEPEQIIGSAFDDNRVLTKGDKPAGRHGTYVTTIINQHSPSSVSVLPVKAFNCGGYGTLFDVLCCLNYVLAQKLDAKLPIQVLNASWVGQVDEAGKALLDSKFSQFEQAGILVIAAAGNQKRDLGNADLGELYPACYSTNLGNVITVTCVERKYKAVKRTARTTGLRNELSLSDQRALLADWRLNGDQYEVFADGYGVTQNYSNTTVSVGVYGGLITQTGTVNPFGFTDAPLEGSSFAAARVSGAVASYLREKRITLTGANIARYREEILTALTREENTLKPFIQEGRLLN